MKNFLRLTGTMLCALCILIGALPLALAQDAADAAPLTEDEVIASHVLDPINPNASQQSKNLLAYLSGLSDSPYFVAGQFDMNTNSHYYNMIKEQFGVEPGLYSAHYNMSLNKTADFETGDLTNVEQVNEQLQQHYENGNILLVHVDNIHELAYKKANELNLLDYTLTGYRDMIVEFDETNPDRNMELCQVWDDYMDRLLVALEDLENRGVKAYLIRMFVEFNHDSFYGVSEEGCASFKRIWQQMADRMANSGLTGYLLTFAPVGYINSFPSYPGNEYIDVLSVTMYSEYGGAIGGNLALSYDFYTRTGKPFGASELGSRSGGWASITMESRGDWMANLHSIIGNWPRISWCNCWGDFGYTLADHDENNDLSAGNDDGGAFLNSPFTITLDELPDALYSGVIKAPGIVQLYKTADQSGEYYGLEERTYSTADLQAMGISLSQLRSFRLNRNYALEFYTGAGATGQMTRYTCAVNDCDKAIDPSAIRSVRVVSRSDKISTDKDLYASHNDHDAWKANDGSSSRWTTSQADTAWLMMDLGGVYDVYRYVVRHAGVAVMDPKYNSSDFQLQYSTDGETWTTADTVSGNIAGITDRLVEEFTAQYVRLYITKGNSFPAEAMMDISIAEFELYGETHVDKPGTTPTVDPAQPGDNSTGNDNPEINDTPVDAADPADPDNSASLDDPTDPENPGQSEESSSGGKKKVTHTKTVSYFPWWAYVLIAAGVLVIAGGILLLVLARRRKKAQEPQ